MSYREITNEELELIRAYKRRGYSPHKTAKMLGRDSSLIRYYYNLKPKCPTCGKRIVAKKAQVYCNKKCFYDMYHSYYVGGKLVKGK